MTQSAKKYRKRVSGIISLLLTICLVSSANAEQILYCSTELATGIAKKDGKWITGSFKPDRYTIKFNSDFTKVEGFRDFSTPLNCYAPYTHSPEQLSCSERFTSLVFNRETLRFTLFQGSPGGYTDELDKSDTETIEAGTCEKF